DPRHLRRDRRGLRLGGISGVTARPAAGGRRDRAHLQLGDPVHHRRRALAGERAHLPHRRGSGERPAGPGDGPDGAGDRIERRRPPPGRGLPALRLAWLHRHRGDLQDGDARGRGAGEHEQDGAGPRRGGGSGREEAGEGGAAV
ncbi:MAG: Na(+) H(+) antiporter subunit C, partial [uncultured Rubrobacteraceae bacterium]